MSDVADTNAERPTMAVLLRELQAMDAKIGKQFETLREEMRQGYPSIDAHDELMRRVVKLEAGTVPLSTHDIECKRVEKLEADLKEANAAIARQDRRMWWFAGVAATAGTVLSWLVPVAIKHL